MNVKEVKEILIDMGFVEGLKYGYGDHTLVYNFIKSKDRHYHVLVWAEEHPANMGIVRESPITGATKELTERDFERNINGLASSALAQCYAIKQEIQKRGLDFVWGGYLG